MCGDKSAGVIKNRVGQVMPKRNSTTHMPFSERQFRKVDYYPLSDRTTTEKLVQWCFVHPDESRLPPFSHGFYTHSFPRQLCPHHVQYFVDGVRGNGSQNERTRTPGMQIDANYESNKGQVTPVECVEVLPSNPVERGYRDEDAKHQRDEAGLVHAIGHELHESIEVETGMDERRNDGDSAYELMVHDDLVECHPEEPSEYAVLYCGYDKEDYVPRRQ